MIHTVKGCSVVSEAEVDVFLEFSFCFSDPADVGNFISGSSAFSKSSLNIWNFTVHVLLKPDLENFEQFFASMRDERICLVVSFMAQLVKNPCGSAGKEPVCNAGDLGLIPQL